MNWYCVYTRPRKEELVAIHCRDVLGLETYYPRLRRHKTIRRVRKEVEDPLFPRYFFCRFDLPLFYRAISYAPEALGLVKAAGEPATVAETIIDELKSWAGPAGDMFTLKPSLHAGDAVELIDGPMRGISATILRTSDDDDRVALLLSILECGAQMIVNRCQIRAVV